MVPPPMHGRCLIKHSKCFSIPGTKIIAIVFQYNIYTLQHSFQTKCICTLLGYEFSDAALAITYHMYDKWSYILWMETQEGFSFYFWGSLCGLVECILMKTKFEDKNFKITVNFWTSCGHFCCHMSPWILCWIAILYI